MKCPCCQQIYKQDPLQEENDWVVCTFCKGLFQWTSEEINKNEEVVREENDFIQDEKDNEISEFDWHEDWRDSWVLENSYASLVQEDDSEINQDAVMMVQINEGEGLIKVNPNIASEDEMIDHVKTQIQKSSVSESENQRIKEPEIKLDVLQKEVKESQKVNEEYFQRKKTSRWTWFAFFNILFWIFVFGSIFYLWNRPSDVLMICEKIESKNKICDQLKKKKVNSLLILDKVQLLEESGVYHGILKITNMNTETVPLPNLILELRKNSKTIVVRKKIKLNDFFGQNEIKQGEVFEKEFFFGDLEEQVNEYTFELENM